MNTLNENTPAERVWLDSRQVAKLLSIGTRTLWRMVEDGRLPQPIRFSMKLIRWDRAALLAFAAKVQEDNASGTPPPPHDCGRAGKPRFDAVQTAAIVAAVEMGRPVKEVAASLGVHPLVIYKLLRREQAAP